MRCPTCGSPVMVRKNSWECGYCCDCGNLPRPRIVLTVDVEEEPQLTVEGLAENADPDTALLLRKFSEPLGAWDIEELSAMGTAEILAQAYGEQKRGHRHVERTAVRGGEPVESAAGGKMAAAQLLSLRNGRTFPQISWTNCSGTKSCRALSFRAPMWARSSTI